MPIDALASEPHFLQHLACVWRELGPAMRGELIVQRRQLTRAAALGLQAVDATTVAKGSRDPRRPLLVASYGDLKRGRMLGARTFVLMQHGAGQSYGGDPRTARIPNYPGGDDNDDVALFLVPNHHAGGRWRDRYPAARVEVVGSPVLDTLPRRNESDNPTSAVVALTFHWDFRAIPEARSAFGAAMGMLRPLAREFDVIGHGHPRRSDLVGRYRQAGIEHVADFREVCRRADVLVFDNTSAGFEFAATGRPVVVLDAPHYRPATHHGLRFWDCADIGPRVQRARDLPDAIRLALEDPPELVATREAALGLVYPLRSGAGRRSADAIETWLAEAGPRLEAA